MKKISIYLLIALTFTLVSFQSEHNCNVTELKNELSPKLKPGFKYDSSKISQFTYAKSKQGREIEVPLFMGEDYRFLFNTKGSPKNVTVEIYSHKIGHKKRTLLYSLDHKTGQNIYSFEPIKSRKMYVNYTIPESDKQEAGCMVFILGYK